MKVNLSERHHTERFLKMYHEKKKKKVQQKVVSCYNVRVKIIRKHKSEKNRHEWELCGLNPTLAVAQPWQTVYRDFWKFEIWIRLKSQTDYRSSERSQWEFLFLNSCISSEAEKKMISGCSLSFLQRLEGRKKVLYSVCCGPY